MLAQKGFGGKFLEPRWVGRPVGHGPVVSDMEAKHKLPFTVSRLLESSKGCVCVCGWVCVCARARVRLWRVILKEDAREG